MLLKWTTGESNPDLLVASQVSSRWTSRPNVATRTGIEPASARLKASLQNQYCTASFCFWHLPAICFLSWRSMAASAVAINSHCRIHQPPVHGRGGHATSSSASRIRTDNHEVLSFVAIPFCIPRQRSRICRSREATVEARRFPCRDACLRAAFRRLAIADLRPDEREAGLRYSSPRWWLIHFASASALSNDLVLPLASCNTKTDSGSLALKLLFR